MQFKEFDWLSGHGIFNNYSTSARCPGQVNFAIGQVKMEIWWSGGQMKLASVV